MNIFPIPSTDQSLFYLSYIFGQVGNILPPNAAIKITGTIFRTLNTIVLSVGALILVYTTVVGLLATAHEGEFMGKKWSGLWVPLRSLMGIAALFPSASGYTLLQMIFMWVILQGVGAADAIWNTVLNYTKVTGSPLSNLGGSALLNEQSIKYMFQSLVCQASYKAKYSDYYGSSDNPSYFYYCYNSNDSWCRANPATSDESYTGINDPMLKLSPDSKVDTMSFGGAPGFCGKLNYCNEAAVCNIIPPSPTGGPTDEIKTLQQKIACTACKAQKQALQTIIPILGTIAARVMRDDHTYLNFYRIDNTKAAKWILDYCKYKGFPEEQCCLRSPTLCDSATIDEYRQFGVTTLEGAQAMCEDLHPEAARLTPCLNRESDIAINTFFSPYYSKDDPTEFKFTNTSEKALMQLYWPYSLQAYLNNENFIKASVDYYSSTVSNGISKGISEAGDLASGSKWVEEAKGLGWIFAGAYYYQLAQGDSALAVAYPRFQIDRVDKIDPPGKRNNYLVIEKIFEEVNKGTTDTGSFKFGATLGFMNDAIATTAESILRSFMDSMTGSREASGTMDDPIRRIHAFGASLSATAEAFYLIFFTSVIVAVALSDINVIALGTGLTSNPLGAGIQAAVWVLLPMVFAIFAALVTFGSMLGVYVPLIPYLLFVMAAIGWLIGVIESIVAAPLVALGMLSPGGQHEVLGRAEPALMLLLNVFLRPSLMVIGMIMAMLLAYVVVLLVNSTFLAVVSRIGGAAPGLIEILVFVGAYVFLIISVLNKCFSLIHVLPERVITWIGGHAVSYGEGEVLGETKRGTEAAAGTAAAGFGRAAGAPGELTRAVDKAVKAPPRRGGEGKT